MKETDAGKTKQQLLGEQNSLRRELSELERIASGAVNGALQFEFDEISRAERDIRRTLDELAHVNWTGMLGEVSASLAHANGHFSKNGRRRLP